MDYLPTEGGQMKISELIHDRLTDEQMTSLLFSNIIDDKEKGDCIFVPGRVVWEGTNMSEALMLKKEALELGVREGDILIEMYLNIQENVLASLLVLDREFGLHKINRLLIVTTTYHMRRLHLNLKTYMPNWINYSLYPVDDKTTKESNWFLHQLGRERVETEVSKIISYVKQGILVDEEIESLQ